jgi:hypothetical protein
VRNITQRGASCKISVVQWFPQTTFPRNIGAPLAGRDVPQFPFFAVVANNYTINNTFTIDSLRYVCIDINI